MKISKTITPSPGEVLPFTEWNLYILNSINQKKGIKKQLRSNREEFPKGDMTKNKFKTNN